MLDLLVGNFFGANTEQKISEIKNFKEKGALYIAEQARMGKNDVVLEIGSGCGYMSRHIAPLVKKLYCSDISKSFLKMAEAECAGIHNVSFHPIKPYSFRFDFLGPGAVDVVFAHNVFIHLSLFDIFWYLNEIKRVLRPQGRLWFDIANAEALDLQNEQFFLEAANWYKRDNIKAWPMIMKWNSASMVKSFANYFEFNLEHFELNKHFLFTRR